MYNNIAYSFANYRCCLLFKNSPGMSWIMFYSTIFIWLVVYLPLWKMMDFVSWDDDIPFPTEWKVIKTCIWVNYNISLTWIVRPFMGIISLIPLLTMISRVRSRREIVIIYPDIWMICISNSYGPWDIVDITIVNGICYS